VPAGAVLETGPAAAAFPERSLSMPEKRVTVWVQRFRDRAHLVLQWIDPDTGKRKSKSAETADPGEAERKRADHEYELNHGRYQEASRMSWERFRELFEAEYLPGVREGTRKVYRNVFRLFEEVCNPKALRSVNERTVSAFASGLRKLPGRKGEPSMMASTIRVRLQFLHTALQWAADQKLTPAVPKFPTIKVPKKTPQPVPAESVEKLLAKADGQMRAYLRCAWLAGLRRNEALALEWKETAEAPWLDLDRDRIVFPAEFVKGDEDQWVPLDPELREDLEALPRQGRKVFRFTCAYGDGPLSVEAITSRVVALARAAGVKLTIKSLRRGFGCRYAGKVPAQVLQKLMRHADIKTTMAYYANVDDAVEEAVLGPKRNRLRNRPGRKGPEAGASSAPTQEPAASNDKSIS
jgi:integrase